MTRKIQRAFNVLLTVEEGTCLDQASERLGVSKGTCMRWALIRLHRMVCHGIPTCASGQTCYVPQMHPISSLKIPDIPGQTTFPTPPPTAQPIPGLPADIS